MGFLNRLFGKKPATSDEFVEPSKEDKLFMACATGDYAMAQAQIRAGADLECEDSFSPGSGKTPLMSATYAGHAHIVRLLIKSGANVNATDKEGHTVWDYVEICVNKSDALIDALKGIDCNKSSAVTADTGAACSVCSSRLDFSRSIGGGLVFGDALAQAIIRTAYRCRNCSNLICMSCAQTKSCKSCGGNTFNVAIEQ